MDDMKKMSLLIALSVIVILLIGGISAYFFMTRNPMTRNRSMGSMMDSKNHSMMDMGKGEMGHGTAVDLEQSNEVTKPLKIPQMLKPDHQDQQNVHYTVLAQEGETSFFSKGSQTKTFGYNGNYLGPVIQLEKGKTVTIRTVNRLSEPTTFHWHGLVVPSSVDGGPHQLVQAGEQKEVTFRVQQDEATLWFHPHPMGETAAQVYKGLSGLMYVTDSSSTLSLPKAYGKNDIPVILQDRTFQKDHQLKYKESENPDGMLGKTLVVNGTIHPYFDVKYDQIRLRFVNGSNARNYSIKLSDGSTFTQIAGDGGYVSKAQKKTNLALSPGERAEVLIDFSHKKPGESLSLKQGNIDILTFRVKEKQKTGVNNVQLKKTRENEQTTDTKADRKFVLFGMGKHVEINGKKFDEKRVDVRVKQNAIETWEIYNKKDMMGGMIHPFHIHGVQFKVLERDGKRVNHQKDGLKDTIVVRPGEHVKIQMTFKEKGLFMYHCHILEHEDNGMMGQLEVN